MDAVKSVSDSELVKRVRAGEKRAFEMLFDSLYPELVSLCTAKVRDEENAKDIVCGVFADLFFRRSNWNPGTSIRAYFVRAVLNRAMNFWRDAKVLERRDEAIQMEGAGESIWLGEVVLPPDMLLEEQEAADLSRELLEKALAKLPENYQTVILLRWQQEMSLAQVSDVLGMSEVAVRKLLSRAMVRLKGVVAEVASQDLG